MHICVSTIHGTTDDKLNGTHMCYTCSERYYVHANLLHTSKCVDITRES